MSSSTKNKILFIEPARHHEVLRSYVLLFHSLGHGMDIMTTQENLTLVHSVLPQECAVYTINKVIEINKYLISQRSIIDQYGMVVLITEEDVDSQIIVKNWFAKTFVLIHNFRTFFDYKGHMVLSENFLDILRFIKYIIWNKYTKREDAIKSFDGYLFPYHVDDFDLSKLLGRPGITLPYLYNEFSSKGNFKTKSIVVPGTINNKSRNYDLIYDSIDKLNNSLNENIDLVFLGRGDKLIGQSILKKFKKITTKKIKLIYFESELDQATYDQYMKDAFMLLLPLKINLTHSLIQSVGGKYSMSGSIGDMVRYGKKAFIIDGYILPHFLERHTIRFNAENLCEKLKHHMTLPAIHEEEYIRKEEFAYFHKQINLLMEHARP